MALLIEELCDGNDVGSVIVHLETRQVDVDVTWFSSQLNLTFETTIAPVQQNNTINSLNLIKIDFQWFEIKVS